VAARSKARTVFARSNPTWGMYVCVGVYSMFVLPCVQVAALRRTDPRPKSPTKFVDDQETEKPARAQKRAVEP
jgi:hypothetical protein